MEALTSQYSRNHRLSMPTLLSWLWQSKQHRRKKLRMIAAVAASRLKLLYQSDLDEDRLINEATLPP